MAMNRIQFQPGLSLTAFLAQFGTDEQCADALEASRWPQGFRCPECGNADYYLLKGGKHKTIQCQCCRLQTSLIAGTLFQSTHLALSIGFLAIYLVDAGCQHRAIIADGRKPKDLPEFNWINTVLGNLKTSLGGAYHAFDFAKYGTRYLGAFAYHFNRGFHLETLPLHLVVAAVTIGPRPACWLRQAEESC
jgi:hypothetical protein